MEWSKVQKIIVALVLIFVCLAVFILGENLDRSARFGNVFIVGLGAFYVFPVICRTDMYMAGLTAEVKHPKHLVARILGFLGGAFLMVWGVSRAVVA
nr:hypothetical protein [uncultured bacterium]